MRRAISLLLLALPFLMAAGPSPTFTTTTSDTFYSNRDSKSDYSGGSGTTSNESLKIVVTNPSGTLVPGAGGASLAALSSALFSEQSSSLTTGLRSTVPTVTTALNGFQTSYICCSQGGSGGRISSQFNMTLNRPSGNALALVRDEDDNGVGITDFLAGMKVTSLGAANDGGTDFGPLSSGTMWGVDITNILREDAKFWQGMLGLEIDYGARPGRNTTGGSVANPTYANGHGIGVYSQFGNVPPTYDASSNPNPQLYAIEVAGSYANSGLGAASNWGVDCGLCFGGTNPINATGLAQDPGRLIGSATRRALVGIEPYTTLTGIDFLGWNFADWGGTALAGQSFRSPGFQVTGEGHVVTDHVSVGAAGKVTNDATTGLTLTGTQRYTVTAAAVDDPGNYYLPGQTATYCTGSPCFPPVGAPSFLVTQSKVTAVRAVNQAGSGGVDGACTLVGTTGSPTPATFDAVISGGAILGEPTVATAGTYTTAPYKYTHELVDGSSCGLLDSIDTNTLTPPVVTASGSGYVIGEVITAAGGTAVTPATFTVTKLTAVNITVANAGTTPGAPGATCTISGSQQSSTSNGQTWFANVTLDGSGFVSTINSFAGGVYTTTPTTPDTVNAPLISGSPCGALAGATFNLTLGAYAVTLTNPGSYQGPFLGTFTQASSTGAGTGATFKAGQWIGPELNIQMGANTVQVVNGGNLASAPANPVAVYSEGALNGLTLNLTTAQEPGDVAIAPASGAVATILDAPLVISKLGGAPVAGPGAGKIAIFAVAGAGPGTCKIQAQAGTSATPVDVTGDIGGGC